MLATAYDTLARRSELAALDVDDLQLDGEGGCTVLVRRPKTDQEGHGSERYVAPDTIDHLQAWIRASRLEDKPIAQRNELGQPMVSQNGIAIVWRPLFRSIRNKTANDAISPADVARRFKVMAAGAGLPAVVVRSISAHSTRVGAAQDMVRAGLALPAVMQSGGWKSPEMIGDTQRGSKRDVVVLPSLHGRRSDSGEWAPPRRVVSQFEFGW